MKIALIPGDSCLRNRVFDPEGKCNRDNRASRWIKLKKKLEKEGHQVNTIDIYNPSEVDLIIIMYNFVFGMRFFLDVIKQNPEVTIFYHRFEPEIVEPLNNKNILENWDMFDRIYTYRDDYVDNEKFFKLNMHNYADIKSINPKPFEEKKFLCIINSFRQERYPRNDIEGTNLYKERIRIAKHFAKKDSIDIYGRYWERCEDENVRRNYRGTIEEKKEVLKQYKFAVCFENQGDTSGYISEKIIDCIEAGVIPIYYGASNIGEYFPKNTYIDFRKYDNLDELKEYLDSLTKEDFKDYIENMRKFIKSEEYHPFTEDAFMERLLPDIKKCEKKKERKNFLKIKMQLLKTLLKHPYISYHNKKKGFLFFTLTKW